RRCQAMTVSGLTMTRAHPAGRRSVSIAGLYQYGYTLSMKPVTWMGSAKRDLVACAPDVRQVVGRELERVQRGASPTDWKPMASVGPGAREIRVHVGGERRVVYVATFPEA